MTTLPSPARSIRLDPAPGYQPQLDLPTVDALRTQLSAAIRSENTVRAYTRHIRDFCRFCRRHGLGHLPAAPDTVARFLAEYGSSRKPATLAQAAAAIAYYHERADQPIPTRTSAVRGVLEGHRRLVGTAPQQKHALQTDEIRRICALLDQEGTTRAQRDKALILLGYSGALRRSELAALALGDVAAVEDGLLLTIRRSKADQEGGGQVKGIAAGQDRSTCPVTAYLAWIDVLRTSNQLDDGPVFRRVPAGDVAEGPLKRAGAGLDGKTIARIIKARAAQAGIDPASVAGHSLRRGHVTQAGRNGATATQIAQQTGHASLDMILRYTEAGDRLRETTSRQLGL